MQQLERGEIFSVVVMGMMSYLLIPTINSLVMQGMINSIRMAMATTL
jgi:hypothetical protein